MKKFMAMKEKKDIADKKTQKEEENKPGTGGVWKASIKFWNLKIFKNVILIKRK